MRIDEYGAVFLTANELFDSIYSGKVKDFQNLYIEDAAALQFNTSKNINRDAISSIPIYQKPTQSANEFDKSNQLDWFMPQEYKDFNMVEFLLDKCQNEEQYNRVAKELELFVQHGMYELLCYLKYLVDTMRDNKVVWGVGRGSSVASYCLFLIGIHKIDSLKYKLDIKEFLK
jgi:DNA polymerase III alpha subunit